MGGRLDARIDVMVDMWSRLLPLPLQFGRALKI